MDPFIQKAKNDLETVTEEINALLSKQRKLRAFLDAYDETPRSHAQGTLSHIQDQSTAPTSNKERVTRAVIEILSAMQPLQTRALLSKLEERGITIGSTDKIIGLSSILSKDGRFVASRSAGWSLKK